MEVHSVNDHIPLRRAVRRSRQAQRGMSLIELMVACLLALFLLAGLISVMLIVSSSSRAMQASARIQENARFALSDMARRLRTSSEASCLSYNGRGRFVAAGAAEATEAHRVIDVLFDATGGSLRLGTPGVTTQYAVDAASFLRGFECTNSQDCAPNLDTFPAMALMGIPDVGTTEGRRANGSDVLYLRQLGDGGARVIAQSNGDADGFSAQVTLAVDASAIGINGTGPVLLTDCASSVLAMATPGGSNLVLDGNFSDDRLPGFEVASQARAYNFDPFDEGTSVELAAYYVGLRSIPDTEKGGTRLISSLMRSNGRDSVVVIDGVERFDLLYHVEDADGFVSVLPADGVDTFLNCRMVDGENAAMVADSGPCGWRSLVGVEVHMLVNSVDPVDAKADELPFSYPWDNAGGAVVGGSIERPVLLGTLLSGLAPNRERRSHFSTFVGLRARNP